MRLLVLPALLACLLLSTFAAQADWTTKTTLAGKPVMLDFAFSTNPACGSNGDVTIRVTQAPQNGRVQIVKARNFPTIAASNPSAACVTRRVPGTEARYVPNRGFTGTDSAAVEMFFPSGRTASHSYTIHVR